MATNEIVPVCRCGHASYQHLGLVGRCAGDHGNCPCPEFRALPARHDLKEAEQRRRITED